MRLVEYLHKATARVNALDDGDTVQHRPGNAIPFGDDKHVPGTELVDRLLKLRPTLGVLAAGLLPEDDIAVRPTEGRDLAVEVREDVETRA
jgi:hypothetical protein